MTSRFRRRTASLLRMCLRKRRYHDLEEAKDAARAIKNLRGVTLRTYFCPACRGFHHTREAAE